MQISEGGLLSRRQIGSKWVAVDASYTDGKNCLEVGEEEEQVVDKDQAGNPEKKDEQAKGEGYRIMSDPFSSILSSVTNTLQVSRRANK